MSLATQAAIFGVGLTIGALAAVSTSRPKPAPASNAAQGTNNAAVTAPSVLTSTKTTAVPNVDTSTALETLKYGYPGPISDFLRRTAYVAGYDRQKRHPAWTAEHLTAASLRRPTLPPSEPLPPSAAGSSNSSYAEALIKQQQERQQIPAGDRANSVFKEDPEVPAAFRAKLEDYFRSGYDRGHLVPAADAKRSQEAMDETFLLTNIAPQVGEGFNRHYWAYLEDFCRRLTTPFSDVYVFTVPLYLPKLDPDGKYRSYEVIGAQAVGGTPSISVPTHWAKVVLGTKPASPSTPLVQSTSIGAFVLPNAAIPDQTPLETFKVPVEAVERAAGLTLFSDAIKSSSQDLCRTVKCDLIIRRFDDSRKQIAGPGAEGGRGRRGSVSK